jgi:hypothetical protein
MGLQIDADTKGLECLNRFKDLNRDADLMETQSQAQATNTGSRNQYCHGRKCGLFKKEQG